MSIMGQREKEGRNIDLVAIDLAKDKFQICYADARGKTLGERQVKRKELQRVLGSLPQCSVAMEACGSAHHWARLCLGYGHKVKLIPPQYVKPFVRTNKNDRADAAAIAVAALQPSMPTVKVKSIDQQELMAIHRMRAMSIRHRTAQINGMRGLLYEFGIVFRKGTAAVRRGVAELLNPMNEQITSRFRGLLAETFEELLRLDARIASFDAQLLAYARSNERCQRLMSVPGVGIITATALIGSIADWNQFSKGRSLSAYLGLVPRQHSSGGKSRLLGISKRGDVYLRWLLVHGARSVLQRAAIKKDRLSRWATGLQEKRGFNRACVALANKLARRCWAVMVSGNRYQESMATV